MRCGPAFLPMTCFVVAMLCARLMPDGKNTDFQSAAIALPIAPTADTPKVGASKPELTPALLNQLGLTAAPTLEEVFAAHGIDRNLRMTLFIQKASPEDLAEAIARAAEEGNWDPALIDQIWLRWTELDPAGAIASTLNHGQAWWAWAGTDPQAALAAAAGKPGPLADVIRSIGEGDPAWARRLIAEHPETGSREVWNGILQSLSRRDPAAAAALALEQNIDPQSILEDWASRHPEAAREWIAALPDNPVKRAAMQAFVRKRCAIDPSAGLPHALALPPGAARDDILTNAIMGIAVRDSDAAIAAAHGLPPGAGREGTLGILAEKLAAEDPAKAFGVLGRINWNQVVGQDGETIEFFTAEGRGYGSYLDAGGSAPGPSAKGAMEKLLSIDPAGTLAVLAAQPIGEGAPVAEAVRQWAGEDPEAASLWLRGLSAGEVRDRGIDGLVRRLIAAEVGDFEAALTWADSATPGAREPLLRNALNSYYSRDPVAATAAAENLGIQRGPMAQHFPSKPY